MFKELQRAVAKATRLARASQGSAAKIARLALIPVGPKPTRKTMAPRKAVSVSKKVTTTAPKSPALDKQRSSLGETIRRISAGGLPARPPLTRKKAGVARGASFTEGHVSSGSEVRSFKLYVPAKTPTHQTDDVLPLVVMLHGCSQTPDDFALGTAMNLLADEHRVIVVYPAQSSGANSKKCWNWYKSGLDGDAEMAVIVEIVRTVVHNHHADPRRIYIAGMSAGGATASAVANAYPKIFAAVGVHSGLPVGAAHNMISAIMAMKFGSTGQKQDIAIPTIVFHGDADTVVHPGNGRAVAARGLAAFPHLPEGTRKGTTKGRAFSKTRHGAPNGRSKMEHWSLHGGGHAWSGGNSAGSFTDPEGPDASREMLRFFLQHRMEPARPHG